MHILWFSAYLLYLNIEGLLLDEEAIYLMTSTSKKIICKDITIVRNKP